ncbi:zinc finger MYM-type protein 1 isoform X1 [Astyanax mexicanus]|uniref:zinc finger MYM-type protein 1 isoform X1 n=2 Tax=Astyanax mexicanus TaxID=7994 RepID=UPI0020CB55C8|nr:zinc finger MYM-type protein 1 isoform X1 [Astyanax mexicanus]XP_022539317.2 zinc finger MYM-type protein 1 isoform X1 [Astyanax mexicanus]
MKRKSDISHFFQKKKEACAESQVQPENSSEGRATEPTHNERQEREDSSAGESGAESEETLEQGETDEHHGSEAECEDQRKELFVSTNTAPSDISKCRDDSPVQPMLKIYPRTKMGDRRRSFKAAWYNIHPWLEYSKHSDSAYCFACRHFSPPKSSETVFDSVAGFRNWKKATYKEGGFAIHARSERHKQAMIAWRDYQKAVKNDATLLNALNKEHNKQITENRDYIKTIAEVLLLTATQNIAQRGHNESADSDNKGNFMAILETIAKHDKTVKKRLTSIHNAKYTSKVIQNEVLSCLADMVRTKIIEEVKDSEVFSIMVDETKDVKKKEQISLVVRYYFSGAVHESFLHFESADRLDAAGLTDKIIHILQSHGLEYRDNLVGQAYDGASVMSGKYTGVQARIKEQAKHAFYVHCSAHCLNLVLVDTVKTVPEADQFFSLLERLYVFTSGSYVHQKWLSVQKEMYEGAPRELQRLSDTRWACRYMSLRNIIDRLPAIKRVLQEIAHEHHGDRSVEARGLLAQIDLQFIVYLVTFCKVFGETKLLSDMLQSPSLDLSKAVDLVEALIQTLNDYRNESFFDSLWNEVLTTAEQCDTAVQPTAKRQKKLSSKLGGHCVLSTVGQKRSDSELEKESFRTGFFYPVLDHILTELNRRFSSRNCDLMNGIQALNPKSDGFLKEDTLFSFAKMYESNIEDLGHELHQFRRILERKIQTGTPRPFSVVELASFMEPYKEVFFELYKLCKVAVSIPVTTASCERSFSTLKLVKTYLRSTMTDERLSNLGVLSIESRRAKTLNLEEFVDLFARNHKNRRIQLM